mmetsp:Transcript_27403/g.38649  ORF Transcript_27403/g.38649 Transcript_27403/m.38649 type:complete len:122 (-) Transcript_27403:673-1038(-)
MVPNNCTNVQFNLNTKGTKQQELAVSDIVYVANKRNKQTVYVNTEEEENVDWTNGKKVNAIKSLMTVSIDGEQYPIYVREQDAITEGEANKRVVLLVFAIVLAIVLYPVILKYLDQLMSNL